MTIERLCYRRRANGASWAARPRPKRRARFPTSIESPQRLDRLSFKWAFEGPSGSRLQSRQLERPRADSACADRERGPIKKEDVMSIVAEHELMWTLSADHKTVRLAL